MARYITNKQLEILKLLYRFRFLNRLHIQTILNHKDPKRINTWLKDLTEKKLIGRQYSTKLLENTKPAVYYLLPASKEWLLKENDVVEDHFRKLYKEKTRSQRFIDHTLTVADFYLRLQDPKKENCTSIQKLIFCIIHIFSNRTQTHIWPEKGARKLQDLCLKL